MPLHDMLMLCGYSDKPLRIDATGGSDPEFASRRPPQRQNSRSNLGRC